MEVLCPDEKIATDLEGDVLTLNDDVDNQNLSSDNFLGSGLMLDTSELAFDGTESEQTNNDDDGSPYSEIKSLEQDEPQAVWVKWRGKWQSGIRCARCDWPLSTLKAKPTHERKQYLVIFFPRTRNYSWADVLLIRPISEFPHPIPYKTHTIGVKMVRDLNLARRFITQRLAISILNILEQLNYEALSEEARDAMVLKDFAMGASRCVEYSDLGKILLKLENMILHYYIASNWLHQPLESWKKRCEEANSAEKIEMLKEEFSDSISWDKVNSLPTSPSDWKSWKLEAMKLFPFSISNPLQIDMVSTQPTAGPNKRPKLEIRRAETHSFGSSHPPVPVETNSNSLNPYDVVVSILSQETSKTEEETKWKDIVVEDAGFSIPGATTAQKSMGIGNHNPQCAAFVESKSRQCARYASEGNIYCCAHLPTRSVGYSNSNSERMALRSVDSPMCGGTTVLGTNCKHRALIGSSFCKKHRKNDEDFLYSEVSVPIEVEVLDDTNKVLMKMPESAPSVEEEVARCVGLGIDEGETCLESLKRHSLYCKKHIPDWLKPARNGKTRIVSKKIFVELLKSCHSREQKLKLHKACGLFYKLFKRILSLRNTVPAEEHFQWAVSEASNDIRVGEFLMKLVSCEKERLTSLWDFGDCLYLQHQSSSEEFVSIPVEVLNDSNNGGDRENNIKCKICLGNFEDDEELGKHWMENHRKEAQWHFRGFVCAVCLDSFTNRKLLEAHVNKRHHVEFVEQCMLLQCIPCGSHFGNLDQLWAHVLSTHPTSLRFSESQNRDEIVGVSSTVPDNRRFICKFCGLKFDLLPDLGRHHQAAHMGIQTKKKGIQLYAQRLKSKALNSASYKIRNRSMQNIKKRIQSSNKVITKLSIPEAAIANLDTLANSDCSSIARTLIPEIKKTKLRPSNSEILSVATPACCKVSLQASLEEKYGILPERLYLKAAKLCSERNISIQWHRDGFICPRGCIPSLTLPILTPVEPMLNKPRYSVSSSVMASEWTIDECHCVVDSRHFSMDLSKNNIVLCDDISFGQESVPIACVVDEVLLNDEANDGEIEYSFPWESFTYVTKPLLDKSIVPELEGLQLGCVCAQSKCSSATCDHVYLFDNDYEDAKDIYGKSMNGRFPYDESGRIILQKGYLVYECNQRCCCTSFCQNRVLQNGVKVKMEIFKTEKKGWAVRTRQAIPCGTFVCEYIGEVIDENEANERRNRYGEEGCKYHFEIDDNLNVMSRLIEEQVHYVIDATNYGNVSRYINHGCSPNLVSHQVLVESMDSQLAHIGLYASRDIAVGEELTYDYRYKLLPGEGCPCLCGFSDCRGRLY